MLICDRLEYVKFPSFRNKGLGCRIIGQSSLVEGDSNNVYLNEKKLIYRELVRLMHDFDRCPNESIKKHINQDIALLKQAIHYKAKK